MQALKSQIGRPISREPNDDALRQQVATLTREVEQLRSQVAKQDMLEADLIKLREKLFALESRVDRNMELPSTPHFTSTPILKGPTKPGRSVLLRFNTSHI